MMLGSFARTLAARSSSSSTSRMAVRAAAPVASGGCGSSCYSTTAVRQTQLPESVVVLEYKYGPRFLQRREPYHQGHLFLAQEMIDQGQCIAGGPVAPHKGQTYDGVSYSDDPTGAFFWFTNLESAQEFLEKDPYACADLVTSYSIYDWNVVVSRKY